MFCDSKTAILDKVGRLQVLGRLDLPAIGKSGDARGSCGRKIWVRQRCIRSQKPAVLLLCCWSGWRKIQASRIAKVC